MSGDDFEREREDYFERIKGTASTAAGDFKHSSYAAGDLARWHPAMFDSSRSESRRARISIPWLIAIAAVTGIALGILIARSLG